MNLKDLSDEYLSYKERYESEDEEDALDEDEEEEFAELVSLNKELNDALEYPRVVESSLVVPAERDELANYGEMFAESVDGFNSEHPLWNYVDFAQYGEDLLTDAEYVEWDGHGYYVEVAW